ncbi:Hpt domain-containing protein [bacterium]|nr:MAG: Hpt domain-containing protein [bacterium]
MASDAAFDADRLRELFGEDEGELVAFLGFALCSIREVIEGLATAVARRDGEATERLGHELKGACANAGARSLEALGQRLEEAGSAHSWAYAEQLIEDAEMALAEVAAYVTARASNRR